MNQWFWLSTLALVNRISFSKVQSVKQNIIQATNETGSDDKVKPVNESFAVGSETREGAGNVRVNLHNLPWGMKI